MIVVTGGAGFIGSALVWELNRRGESNILIVDHLGESEKWKNLVNLTYEDYLDRDEFIDKVQKGRFDGKISRILHMGACSSTTERDSNYLMYNNYKYTRTLAVFALRENIPFLYASSAATYGDGAKGFSDEEATIRQYQPLNMYAYSKQLFDCWALKEGLIDEITGVKFFNVFGPNEYHKGSMRSVAHQAFGQIRDTGKVRLFKSHHPDYKDGWQLRDFVYVKDAVNMTLFLLAHKIHGIYNVGTGKARSFHDFAAAVFKAMDKPVNIEYFDMPVHLREKYQYFTCAEMDKISQAGYDSPFTGIEEAVNDYVCHYLQTDDPYLGKE